MANVDALPPFPTSDVLAAMANVAEAANQFAAALAAVLNPKIESANQAWALFRQAFTNWLRSERIAPIMAEILRMRAAVREWAAEPADLERAYRNYAAWYNARHRRRISWRRLSAPQRQAAALEYLAPSS